MQELTESDKKHLEAAEGWLELENFKEAQAELRAIGQDKASNPKVMLVVCRMLAAVEQWKAVLEVGPIICQQQPDEFEGHLHLATALHALNRTAEAREVLLKVVDKFPRAYPIPFALACYACRLGNIEEARRWWNQAQALTNNKHKLEELARTEPDLEALWERES